MRRERSDSGLLMPHQPKLPSKQMQRLELDGDNLAVNVRKVQSRLTCAKERNDNVNVCWSRERPSDEKQKERNVKYSKDHGASDGIDAIGLCEVVARRSVSHDSQETVEIKISGWKGGNCRSTARGGNGGKSHWRPFEWNGPLSENLEGRALHGRLINRQPSRCH